MAWTSPQGGKRRVVHWPSAGGHSATLMVIVHGHGEHIGRYQRFVDGLADLPVEFVGYDHEGHGESDGKRGDADGIDALAEDLAAFVPHAKKLTGRSRAVLFGHSMGGVVVARLLTTPATSVPIEGAILSDPVFAVPRTAATQIKIALGRLVGRIAPRAIFRTGLDAKGISRDAKVVEEYRSDPLVHDRISARLGRSLIDDGEACSRAGANIRIPSMVYHGTGDRIASIEGTRRFVEGARKDLVEYHELAGVYHEPHNEPREEAERVFALIREWLVGRIA